AQRRQGEQRPHQPGEQPGRGQREPEIPFARHREHRDRIRADGVEADVAEGHLPGQPEQHVKAHADDRGQRERRHDEHVIAVRRCRKNNSYQENQDERADLHTFFTWARPKRPFGISASATITSVKLRICVYAEPRKDVISASATPKSRPASITPHALAMPPRIATANALMPNSVPMSECTLESGAIMMPATPASSGDAA